ncbi:MAG: hypothetical protein C4527_05525 [Candidatus Omnitrophota bacterium]|jgi:hypothetical protein|nr:MAG: hypothetical protein C4527_05525 [Candidatus Omnitrophota bacterium]
MWNLRFILAQGFLFLVWIVLRAALTTGLAIPGLQMTGVYCFHEAVILIFIFLWLYAFAEKLGKRIPRCGWMGLLEITGIIAFLGAIVWIDRDPLAHGLNSSGDHLMHFTLATLSEWNLRCNWSLTGWCTAFGAGFPLNELYPPGGNLIFCLFRLLTFGLFTREWAYTIVVFLSYITFAFLLYAIVRKWFGRIAALFLLLFLLLDGGDGMNFGWPQFFFIGMWASGLGFGLSLYAFSLCADFSTPFTKWRILKLAAVLCVSILLHPLFLYTNTLWIALLLFVRRMMSKNCLVAESDPAKEESSPASADTTFVFKSAGILIGVGLAAFWWFPFLFSREWIYPYGFWGRTMPDIGREIMNGTLFQNATAFHTTLGLIGIVWGLFSRRLFAVALALFSAVNIFLGMDAARTFFKLELAQAFFEHIQLERLVGIGKISAMLLAAGFLGTSLQCRLDRTSFTFTFFETPTNESAASSPESHAYFRRILSDFCVISVLVLLSTPLLAFGKNVLVSAWRWHVEPMAERVGSPPETPSYWPWFIDMLHVLEAREPERGPELFFQNPLLSLRALTYDSWRMVSAPAFAAIGIAGPVYMPAVIIGTRPFFFHERTMDLANVKYVFDWKIAPYHEIQKLEGLTPVYENQEMILYERSAWNGQGWIMDGPGTLAPLPGEGRNLRFEVSEAKANSHLRLGISRYRKWNAYINGTPVRTMRMEQSSETPEDRKLIGIQLHNGVLEIRYEQAWYDIAARMASGLFLVLCIFLGAGNRVWRRLQRWSDALTRQPLLAHGSKTFLDAAVLVVILTILLTSFFLPEPRYVNRFEYIGELADRVGDRERIPDGRKDLCFELDFAPGTHGKRIVRLELRLLQEEGKSVPGAIWQTQPGFHAKIGVSDMMGIRLDHEDGTVSIPDRYFQKLHLFVSRLEYVDFPETIHAICTIVFEDGTTVPIRTK